MIIFNQEYPELSPYQFASNTPIWAIDLDGLEKLAVSASPTKLGGTHYNSTQVETFADQANRLQRYGYHIGKIANGKDLIRLLEEETTKYGEIKCFVSFSHGKNFGLPLDEDEGFFQRYADITILPKFLNKYGDNVDLNKMEHLSEIKADCLNTLESKIKEGKIKFSKDAVIFLDACNTGNFKAQNESIEGDYSCFARDLAEVTGATVIGCGGNMAMQNPSNPDGKFKTEDKNDMFYKFEKGKKPEPLLHENGEGKLVPLNEIDMDNYIITK